jgi:hypothetical protein
MRTDGSLCDRDVGGFMPNFQHEAKNTARFHVKISDSTLVTNGSGFALHLGVKRLTSRT